MVFRILWEVWPKSDPEGVPFVMFSVSIEFFMFCLYSGDLFAVGLHFKKHHWLQDLLHDYRSMHHYFKYKPLFESCWKLCLLIVFNVCYQSFFYFHKFLSRYNRNFPLRLVECVCNSIYHYVYSYFSWILRMICVIDVQFGYVFIISVYLQPYINN